MILKRSFIRLALPGLLLLLINGCTALQELAKVEKPVVTISRVQVEGLDFKQADLRFTLAITNPNPVTVTLPGFGYNFKLEHTTAVKGKNEETVTISGGGTSEVEILLTLTFEDIYKTIRGLKSKDSAAYQIICDLYFDIPVIGKTPVSIEKAGYLPLPRLPSFQVSSLKLKKMSYLSADLELSVKMNNPNNFIIVVSNIDYNFAINGMEWIRGLTENPISIYGNGEHLLAIPISLSFIQMGQTIYNLISEDKALNYEFDSSLDVKTSLPLIKEINLPVHKKGTIHILK